MKKLFFSLIFALLFFGYAQNPQKPEGSETAWRYLMKAQTAYEEENYAEAVKLAVTAQNRRKSETEWASFTLEQALKPVEVQRAGETVNDVLPVLTVRQSYDAIEIINDAMQKLPAQKLPFTIAQIKEKVKNSRVYPEADFLLGKLYMLQVEYQQSGSYLSEAWKNADLLDIPEQKYDILYETANLASLKNDFDTFEKTLLLVIADVGGLAASIESPFARSVVQAIKRGTTLDSFFMLYRHEFFILIPAYNKLAEYYFSTGDTEKALSYGALGVLSSFTRLYQAIRERNFEYTYTTFSDFQKMISRYYDIGLWSVKNEIWKACYSFTEILKKTGEKTFSRQFLTSLAQNCPEDYWKRVAFRELFNTN